MQADRKNIGFPGVRLAVAGFLCLALLVWAGFIDDTWLEGVGYVAPCHRHGMNPTGALITAAIALSIVTTLSPVAYRGRTRDRWLAAILAIAPFWVFFVTALGLL